MPRGELCAGGRSGVTVRAAVVPRLARGLGQRLVHPADQVVGQRARPAGCGQPARQPVERGQVGAAGRAAVQVAAAAARGRRLEQALVQVGQHVGVEVRRASVRRSSAHLLSAHLLPGRARRVGRRWDVPGGRGFPSRSSGSSRARPRAHRLLTVPVGQSSTLAASSTDQPYMSTSTRALRCSTGRVRRAASTSRLVTRSASGVAAGRHVLLGQRVGRPGGPAPGPVQAGVHHDPVQPGGHGGVAPARRPPLRPARNARQQGVLQRVGCLLAVAEGAQRHRPEPVAVPADQLAEGIRVAGGVGLQRARRRRRGSPARSVPSCPTRLTSPHRAPDGRSPRLGRQVGARRSSAPVSRRTVTSATEPR